MTDLFIAKNANGEEVVIRTVQKRFESDRKVRKQFEQGIRVLKSLNHANIIPIVDEAKYRGTRFMAVPYHPNLNLRERIAKKDEALWIHQLDLLLQLASALDHLHDQGFLHMDLKPENILIRDDMHLVLVDFDLALKHKNKIKRYKTISGTASYLAPETLLEGALGEPSEVYTFGVCAFELLTFHKPYDAVTSEEYRRMVANHAIVAPSPQQFREDIPKDLAKVILNCLEKDPDRRYPSMNIVHRALKALVK